MSEIDDGKASSDNRGSVSTALAILRHLAAISAPPGVNAIARQLGLPPSSCFKTLKILHAADFVDFDVTTKTYALGGGAIDLARRALDPANTFAIMRDRLEEAAVRLAVAIGLWRIVPGDRIVLIGYAEGSGPTRIHMSVGQRLPMLMGAVGRAIAASLDLPQAELARQFRALRWQAPLSLADYEAQVVEAKCTGHGIDEGHFAPGVTTIAHVVPDALGVPRYGLSAITFSAAFNSSTRAVIADELAALALWAARRLY